MPEQSKYVDDIYGKKAGWKTAGIESFQNLVNRIENTNYGNLNGAADSHYDNVAYNVFNKCCDFLSTQRIVPPSCDHLHNVKKNLSIEDLSKAANFFIR